MKKRLKHKPLPELSFLLEHYEYDPINGVLYKKTEFDYEEKKPVGYKDSSGYYSIRILKKTYKLHRIVYYMFYKHDPGKKVIDHIDGDKGNNRIYNLRAVRHRDNAINTVSRRAKGILPKCERVCGRALA